MFINEMFEKYNLVKLQNNAANVNQDHLSICGFFKTEAEFAAQAAYLQANIDNN